MDSGRPQAMSHCVRAGWPAWNTNQPGISYRGRQRPPREMVDDQLNLFPVKARLSQARPAFRPGNRQQEAGARKARPNVTEQCRTIYAALVKHGPMIRDEISTVTGIKVATLCARLNEMENGKKPICAIRKNGTKYNPETGVHVILYAPNDSSTA